MHSRMVNRVLFVVILFHSVIGYLLWAKLCGTDPAKALPRAGEFIVGVVGNCICSAGVLLIADGAYRINDEDDEALARAKLNSLVIFWSLMFFGGVLAVSFF